MAFYAIYWLDNPDANLWTRLWGYIYFGGERIAHIKTGTEGIFGALLVEGDTYQLILLSKEPKTFDISYAAGISTYYPGLTMVSSQYSNVYYHMFTNKYGNASLSHYMDIYSSLDEMLLAFSRMGSSNPYDPGGTSATGGGGMSGGTIPSDPIDFPSVPDIGAVDAGFVSIWTPTEKQVKDLAKYLWTTDITEGAFWRKLIQNPLDLIFGLQILPVPIYHTDETGDPQEGEYIAAKDAVVLGWTKTGIKMDYIVDQYIEVDCGSIDMEEYWHAFLDYEPYTKIDIFLPYIGTKHLDTNDLMPRTLALKYVIDIASGICVAMLKCDDSVYYQFTGNCASQIPLSVSQMQEIVKGAMSLAVGVGTFVLGSAYGAGAHAAKQAVQTGTAMKAAGAAMVGSGLNSAAKGVNVSRSGTISAAAGLMGVQTPYLIISRPRQAIPENQSTYTGYPSFITEDLGELNGYTEVQMIHLHEMSCTEDEFNEIDELLAAGVIF